MLMALAVLDLPFEAPKHETKFDGTKMTLTAGGPLVVFHEEIKPSAAPDWCCAKCWSARTFFVREIARDWRMENRSTSLSAKNS